MADYIDTTTGIAPRTMPVENTGDYHTVNGVKVDKPSKGIYINNHRKVVF